VVDKFLKNSISYCVVISNEVRIMKRFFRLVKPHSRKKSVIFEQKYIYSFKINELAKFNEL
ncbi:MAG TPA: hypothetical protein DEO63_04505, partial [Parasutterella excrementihominis]|nr:hypothetical protein [Parasutterella excrementihominis]